MIALPDVVVIGAGAVGCAVARELTRFKISVLVLEKGADVCSGASKGNSAMVHSGFDPEPGSKKAHFNVLGNQMFHTLCAQLNVPFQQNGTLILAASADEEQELIRLHRQGIQNKVETCLLSGSELEQFQVGPHVNRALFAPSGGVVCPFRLVVALAECAAINGAQFRFQTEVANITRTDCGWQLLLSDQSLLNTRAVINCAGTDSARLHNLVSLDQFSIIPRFGGHLVMGRGDLGHLPCTVTQAPFRIPTGGHTKGMGMTPSPDGTVVLGCDAVDHIDPNDTSLPAESIQRLLDYFTSNWEHYPPARRIPTFPRDKIICAFGGLRAHSDRNDFILGEAADASLFFDAAGIESPGLTASPAIGQYLAQKAAERLQAKENTRFIPDRPFPKPFREMDSEERIQAISDCPDYAKMVCYCEQVTVAEIRAAIRRPLGAHSLAAVKMRTRAGMGRCQGSGCEASVVEILCEELHLDPCAVLKEGAGSQILYDRIGTLLGEHSCAPNNHSTES